MREATQWWRDGSRTYLLARVRGSAGGGRERAAGWRQRRASSGAREDGRDEQVDGGLDSCGHAKGEGGDLGELQREGGEHGNVRRPSRGAGQGGGRGGNRRKVSRQRGGSNVEARRGSRRQRPSTSCKRSPERSDCILEAAGLLERHHHNKDTPLQQLRRRHVFVERAILL